MNKITSWWNAHRPTKRRIIQLYAALLTNANLKGFGNGKIYTGDIKKVCVPGLNCYSCPGAAAACPLGALQNALANSGARLPYYVFGILLLYGFLFGRWICGFLCPFGLIQELLHKIKTPKLKKSPVTRALSWLKYVILAFFVILLPLAYADVLPLPAFCKYICPSGTLLGAGGLLSNEANTDMFGMLGPLFTWKFLLLVIFIVGSVFAYRFFCRFFCPLGAIYGLFNKISLLGMKLDEEKCVNCGLCVGQCGMDIRHVGDHECISCGSCIGVCPTKAISFKGPKILLAPNETGNTAETSDIPRKLPKKTRIARMIVAIIMAAVLGGALYYYNFVDKAPADLGAEVGNQCYSYALPVYGGGTVSVEDTRGKVTVINFWGTWCTPCVAELVNEFPLIEAEYGDKLAIIAVHSYDEYGQNVPAFIEKTFPNASYIFCRDNEGNEYCNMLGGGQAWPHTVILDEDGVIRTIIPRATTYEELKEAIDAILAD